MVDRYLEISQVECEFWGPKKERVTDERHCSPDTVRHVSRCLHQSDTMDTCDSDHRPQATRKVDGDHGEGFGVETWTCWVKAKHHQARRVNSQNTAIQRAGYAQDSRKQPNEWRLLQMCITGCRDMTERTRRCYGEAMSAPAANATTSLSRSVSEAGSNVRPRDQDGAAGQGAGTSRRAVARA
jgi:hypothetical protein